MPRRPPVSPRRRCRPRAVSLTLVLLTLVSPLAPPLPGVVPALSPARAEIITSSSTAESSRRAVWQRVFERVPAALRPRRDVLVREISDQEMDDLVAEDAEQAARQDDDDSIVDGIFLYDDEGRPTITLRRSLSPADAPLVFAHELGHLVWDTHLTAGERGRFTAAYKQSKSAKRLVTDYAGESAEEGWAEAFSFFVLKPDTLRGRDPRAFDILRQMCGGKVPGPQPPAAPKR